MVNCLNLKRQGGKFALDSFVTDLPNFLLFTHGQILLFWSDLELNTLSKFWGPPPLTDLKKAEIKNNKIDSRIGSLNFYEDLEKNRDDDNLHAAIFNSVRDPIIEDKETPAKDKTFNVLSKAGWSLTQMV